MQSQDAFAIDFNLHRVPAAAGLPVPPAAASAMLNISEAEFTSYTAGVEAENAAQAAVLLSRAPLAAGLAALRARLPAGGRILAAGDSITTYRHGYVELLRAMLEQRYPEAGLEVLNRGESGYTSTHAREETYTQLLALAPALVTLMFGANDCKRFGGPDASPLVSAGEYARNMAAIAGAFLTHARAQVVLFTPPPVLTTATNHAADFAAMRMTWDNSDIEACAAAVRQLAVRHNLPCVDLTTAFGLEPDPTLYLVDGLHPGPAGHILILEKFLETLLQRRDP